MTNPTYVVIPNWNGKDLLGACLDSLRAQSVAVRVIVVDNGSVDGSVEFIKKNYPEVTLIELDYNHGFAGGVNVGIRHALELGADFVALFNNDAEADRHWLRQLVKAAEEQPKAGIVTSKFMRIDKKHLDSTGDFYSIYGLPFPRGRNQPDTGQYDDQREIFAASGGASLYRAKMLAEVGLFDEDYFAYYEDVDISFRARLAGWNVLYEPTAIAYHHLSATSNKLGTFSLYHSSKNFVLLYAKNMPFKLCAKYSPLFTYQLLRWLVTSTLRGHGWTYCKGIGKALLLTPSTYRKRRQIQATRSVGTDDINRLLYHHRPPKPTINEDIV